MSDAGPALAGAVVAAALAVAGGARVLERRRSAAQPLHLDGLPTGLVLFTDPGCRNCARTREVLRAGGVEFTEVAHERDPDLFRTSGVTAVPLLVAIAPGGREVGRIAGRVTRPALARLMRRLG